MLFFVLQRSISATEFYVTIALLECSSDVLYDIAGFENLTINLALSILRDAFPLYQQKPCACAPAGSLRVLTPHLEAVAQRCSNSGTT
jgi:hypothetical protein